MNNPFVEINTRLQNIESMLLDWKFKEPTPEPTAESLPQYLTRGEVAKLLRISLKTLDEYSKRGFLKRYTVGNSIRYKSSEVLKAFEVVKSLKYQR
jgi:excisionase family DNA binding protein